MKGLAGIVIASAWLALACGLPYAHPLEGIAGADATPIIRPHLPAVMPTPGAVLPPDDFYLAVRRFSQSISDDTRPGLISICESTGDDGHISFLGSNNDRAFIAALTEDQLHSPSQDVSLSPLFEMVGQLPNPRAFDPRSDTATLDWAFIFDRNGDGLVDYLAYLEGALPVFPENFHGRLPDLSDNKANKEELLLLLSSTRMVFWHMQDANFDGRHDMLFVPMTNDKLFGAWIDSWLITRDLDFDGQYDQCSYWTTSLAGEPLECASRKGKYRVPGRSFAGIRELPLPQSVDLFGRINKGAAGCGLGRLSFYADTDDIVADMQVRPIETVEKGGLYYLKGSEILADGVETIYAEEEPNSLTITYRNGLKDGLETGWNADGDKLFESNFVAGRRQGFHVSWYSNGMKRTATHYRDDVADGVQKRWYGYFKGGKLMAESTYVKGKREGLATVWHPNGKKMMEVRFEDGQRNGIARRWHENGKKEWEGVYASGLPTGEFRYWNERGRIKRTAPDEYPEDREFFAFEDIWP